MKFELLRIVGKVSGGCAHKLSVVVVVEKTVGRFPLLGFNACGRKRFVSRYFQAHLNVSWSIMTLVSSVPGRRWYNCCLLDHGPSLLGAP